MPQQGQFLYAAWMGRRFDFAWIEELVDKPAGIAETIEVEAANFHDGKAIKFTNPKHKL